MDRAPDCIRCRHFVVTWRPEMPRGCRLFGFESRELPSVVVERSSGRASREWELKPLMPRNSGTPVRR